MKDSPCTRARHGVEHGIGVSFAGLAGSCPFFLAVPVYPALAGRIPACTLASFDGRRACSANSPSHPQPLSYK